MRAAAFLVMALVFLGCGSVGTGAAATSAPAPVAREAEGDFVVETLDRIAQIASAILDGDDCMDIVTDRADRLMTVIDPEDRWAGSDNYDVNFEPFVRNKQLLIRLAGLAGFPCDANLWLRMKSKPDRVHLVIRQLNNMYHWYRFGEMDRDPPPEMQRVLDTGERVVIEGQSRDLVAVLAPVRNSLGDVVGVVEVCTSRGRARR